MTITPHSVINGMQTLYRSYSTMNRFTEENVDMCKRFREILRGSIVKSTFLCNPISFLTGF